MVRPLLIVIALAGCRDELVEQVRDVRNEVCACKTAKCGEDAMKQLPQSNVKPNHRAQALARELHGCLAKLYLRERPSTDPDHPESADEPTSPGSAAPASAKKP